MLAAYFCHEGPVRAQNQDAVLVGGAVLLRTETPEYAELGRCGVLAVADGVGGYKGGEIASSIVLECLSQLPSEGPVPSQETVRSRLRLASEMMRASARGSAELASMSSTLAGVIVGEREMAVFNCGDCRVYRLSRPYLSKLTHDHSVVQALFDSGVIGEEEMRFHPRRHVIMSGVGLDDGQTELFFKTFPKGSPLSLFLCSDGVWEAMPLESLEEILSRPALEAAALLAEVLFKMQAQDNVSFIILEI
ncbi:MAG: serine/threonine-protein phosphatase [Deltaproteobacteria bacterium]|nr:serine/threonine-protein phosphatase [Deltaproteobacteria bacterium]